MRCPICGNELASAHWQISRLDWWAGLFECEHCGTLKMSGSNKRAGQGAHRSRILEHWHPACPDCGWDQVSLMDRDYTRFVCWGCLRKWEVRAGRVITTIQPHIHTEPQRIMEMKKWAATNQPDPQPLSPAAAT
jgi:hypothetical protein